MNTKNYGSLTDALTDLKKRGYDSDFETQANCLYCGDLDLRLDPEDFKVDEIYRFNGEACAANKASLYAITAMTGVKGIVVEDNDGEACKIVTHSQTFQNKLNIII
ncbi:MAG: phosphoribosylpyrophosphate synthetase [Ferruginibacter sp.]